VSLWCFDGKQVELGLWAPAAHRFVGPDLNRAVHVLRELHEVLESRFARLLQLGVRKVKAHHGVGLHLVVIDELAMYLTGGDRALRAEFTDLLRDLVSRGRAAGIIVLAATQKPGSDIIPTSLRDLFGYRWALRCTTAAASDTILGSGRASNGITASSVDPAHRGVGYLLAEGGGPVRLRAHYLTDDKLRALAERGRERRAALAADRRLARTGGAAVSGYGRGARLCAHPIRLAGTEHRLDRRTGARPAARPAPRSTGRHLAADRRRAARRQRPTRHDRRTSAAVPHSHRPRVRAGALPAHPPAGGPDLPAPARALPATAAPRLRAAARRRGPAAGHPAVPAVLRLPGGGLWNAQVGELWRRTGSAGNAPSPTRPD